MLGERDLTGTNAERRIKEVIAKGSAATQTYKLKETTKKYRVQKPESHIQKLYHKSWRYDVPTV